MSNKGCVIVGASHAAAELVVSLRRQGWQHPIRVIGDEPYLPYHRPPLSKDYLAGNKELEDILIRPASAYETAGVDLFLGSRVRKIDISSQKVFLERGDSMDYEKLVLTTGSQVRKLPVPGTDLPGVFYLRTLEDVNDIRSSLKQGSKAVIVGGGYIGLETAAVLKQLNMKVTILESQGRILERVTTQDISAFYTRVHEEEGVQILTNASVIRIEGKDKVEKVICGDGQEFDADILIIGIGVTPETALAEDAGLDVDDGILVNEFAETSAPNVLAAGDCTRHHNPIYDRNIRLESVHNAADQAKVAASTICGDAKPYSALPWFWSNQYDMKLQIAGLSEGFDQIVMRGDMTSGRCFAAFYLRQGRVLSVDAVNKPQEFMLGKQLILEKLEVDPAKLADSSLPMKELLA